MKKNPILIRYKNYLNEFGFYTVKLNPISLNKGIWTISTLSQGLPRIVFILTYAKTNILWYRNDILFKNRRIIFLIKIYISYKMTLN
jgi:hypothetical protein